MRMTKKRWAGSLVTIAAICFIAVVGFVIWQTLPQNQQPSPAPGNLLPTNQENTGVDGLYPMWQSQPDGSILWGYLDGNGDWAVEPIYQEALPFYQEAQVAWVKQNDRYGAIDRQGKTVIPVEQQTILADSRDGYMVIANDNNASLYDNHGNKVFGVEGRIGGFNHDVAVFARVKENGAQYGLIDRKGNIVVEPLYAAVGEISGGRPLVKTLDGKVYVLNSDGSQGASLPGNVSISNAGGGYAVYQDANGLLGYVSQTGEIAIPARFYIAGSFVDGAALVKTGAGYGLLSPDGSFALEPQFAQGSSLGHGLYAFAKNSNSPYALYNANGDKLSEDVVCQWGQWQDGALGIQEATCSYLVDRTGAEISGSRINGAYQLLKQGKLFYAASPQSFYYNGSGQILFQQTEKQASIYGPWDIETTVYAPDWYLQMSYPQLYQGQEEYKGVNSLLEEWCLDDYEEHYKTEDGAYLQKVRGSFTAHCLGSLVQIEYQSQVQDRLTQTDTLLQSTCVIDLASGDRLRLEDLFQGNWKPFVAEKVRNAYVSQCESLGQPVAEEALAMLNEAGWPFRKEPFLLEELGITFYVGPLNDGSYSEVFVSYEELGGQIDAQSPLWLALNWQENGANTGNSVAAHEDAETSK